jgi:hypothetical protein
VSLQAFQQQMLQAVLADELPPLQELRSDARADVGSRVAIYRNGYRIRLRDSLATEFPGLGKMMGRRFGATLESYVEAHPSVHYNIRWHGAGLAAFLAYGLPWRSSPELADMAKLDWAISTTFDAADEPVLTAADLANLPADAWANLCLRVQNHLQILSVHHNVDAFRRAADRGDKRPRLRHHTKARHFLVWRQALTVRYRAMDADEMSALNGAMQGESFASLCERLAEFHEAAEALPRMAGLLQQWLAEDLLGGWLLR